MKKFFVTAGLAMAVLTNSLLAQTIDKGTPKGWSNKFEHNLPAMTLPAVDNNYELQTDMITLQSGVKKSYRFGVEHLVDFGLDNAGSFETMPSGDRLWRIRLHCDGALTMNLIFDEFQMASGAYVYIYNSDLTDKIGAYTESNNNSQNQLGTTLIAAQDIIVELFEPAATVGQSQLNIGMVVHGYREMKEFHMAKNLNGSGDCNVDVDCPLGAGWENQRNSVARILNGGGYCTGSLINNTLNDGTPYFITANHCGTNYSSAVFRFRWESPNPSCATTANSTNGPTNMEVNGAITRASNSSSDFCLVELNTAPNNAWGIYFNGWDNSDALTATQATGIHHPSGDIKKICRENQAPTHQTTSFNGNPNAKMWRIADWDQGVTEPGSSGSPLFNQNKKLIGVLSGGAAACNGTNDNNQYDIYGRFGISWDDGASASTRAMEWLDPNSSGATDIDGYDPLAPTNTLDAGIQSIDVPGSGSYCGSNVNPQVVLRNYGSDPLTSCTINYSYNGGGNQTFSWTGNLSANQTEVVTLPNVNLVGGASTLDVSTSAPNGGTDQDNGNDQASQSFTVLTNGQQITLNLTLDCYGSETTWEIQDNGGATLYSGGPYQDGTEGTVITETFCLPAGCYDFIINDSYGDGLNGSQWAPQCTADGTYEILDQMSAQLATIQTVDFGNSETNNFCVTAVSNQLGSNFTANVTEGCGQTTINFTDLSTGTPTTWNWSFPGADQTTSTLENPSITYSTPGTYDVTLEVGDGSTTDTYTATGMITIHGVPSISNEVITDVSCSGTCDGEIDITVTGGTPPYTFSWTGGPSQEDITNQCAGNRSVIITDANNCSFNSTTYIIGSPTPISASGNVTDETNGMDGAVDITVTGGNPPYTYSWNSGETTEDISSLTAGTYIITVTDANGCSRDFTFTVGDQTGVGLIELNGGNLMIYPNPARDFVIIELGGFSGQYDLNLRDAKGRIIWKKQSVSSLKHQINTNNFSEGVYFVEIVTSYGRIHKKIIVQ